MMNSDKENPEKQNSLDDLASQASIDRFLLDDPTFDSAGFELRMLEDLELCERVAASVAELQLVSAALSRESARHLPAELPVVARSLSSEASAGNYTNAKLWTAIPVLAVAASLVFVVVGQRMSSSPVDRQADSSADLSLASIANNWSSLAVNSGEQVYASLDEELSSAAVTLQQNAPDSDPQTDWVMEAVREYYLESDKGSG